MKKLFTIISLCFISIGLFAQETKEIYDTQIDGMKQIDQAIEAARESGKHVLIQVGGNWCPWCIRFHGFVKEDPELTKLVSDNYEVVLLNYSQENQNQEALARLEYPQRFGFPVFVILDSNGKRIHTQNSAYLEEGKSYNRETVIRFMNHWTKKAIDPQSYKR